MRPAELVLRLAALALPTGSRERYREQWAADLRDCGELGIPRHRLVIGALSTALTFIPTRGHTMRPIGPLAIALRHTGASGRASVAIALALIAMLVLGIALLLL